VFNLATCQASSAPLAGWKTPRQLALDFGRRARQMRLLWEVCQRMPAWGSSGAAEDMSQILLRDYTCQRRKALHYIARQSTKIVLTLVSYAMSQNCLRSRKAASNVKLPLAVTSNIPPCNSISICRSILAASSAVWYQTSHFQLTLILLRRRSGSVPIWRLALK
jgi:hypothetical protein